MARKGTFGAYKEAYKNPPVDAAGAVTKQLNTEINRIDKKEAADKLAKEKKAKEDADRQERGVAAENKKLKDLEKARTAKNKTNATLYGKTVANLIDTQDGPPSAKAISVLAASRIANLIESNKYEGIEQQQQLEAIWKEANLSVTNILGTDEVFKKNKIYANDDYFNTFVRGNIDSMAAGNLALSFEDKDGNPFPDNKPRWVGVDDEDNPVMLTNIEYQAQLVRNGEALDNAFNTEDMIVNGNKDAGILPLNKFMSENSITLDEKKDKDLFITEVRDRFALQYGQNPIGAARDLYNNRKELKIPDEVATRFAEIANDLVSGVTVSDADKQWYAETLSKASSTIADIFIEDTYPKAFDPETGDGDGNSINTIKKGSNTGANASGGYVQTTIDTLNNSFSNTEIADIVEKASNGDLSALVAEGGKVDDRPNRTVLLDKNLNTQLTINWDIESLGAFKGDERTGSGSFTVGEVTTTFTDWNDFKAKLGSELQGEDAKILHTKFDSGEYLVESEPANQAANLNVRFRDLKGSRGITFDVSKNDKLEIIQNGKVVTHLDLNADYPLPKRADFDTEQDFIDASNEVGKTREAAIDIQLELLKS